MFNQMLNTENQYLQLLQDVIRHGEKRSTRGGAKTRALFGQPRIVCDDVSKGFPLLTTKKVSLKNVFEELMLFIRGQTDATILSEKGVKIWDANTSAENLETLALKYGEGDMGPMYGFQWRHCGAKYAGYDVDYCVRSRRGPAAKLHRSDQERPHEPAHRDDDMEPGGPAQGRAGTVPRYGCAVLRAPTVLTATMGRRNWTSCTTSGRATYSMSGRTIQPGQLRASYALLLMMVASVSDCTAGRLYYGIGDAHVYEEHVANATVQLERNVMKPPRLSFNQIRADIAQYEWSDIKLEEYTHHAPVRY
jgi:thymidylate synthase